jgi:hypothetical protein
MFLDIGKQQLTTNSDHYLPVIDEILGTNIRENVEETHYLIGSNRITALEQTTLENDTNFDAIFSDNTEPVGWTDKTPPAP